MQEDLDQSTENIEQINENQELSKSLGKVIDKYKALRAAGKSTKDTMKELNE
jgi:hypothetical protein